MEDILGNQLDVCHCEKAKTPDLLCFLKITNQVIMLHPSYKTIEVEEEGRKVMLFRKETAAKISECYFR